MPACKMVSSGIGMFGEGIFNIFDEWLSSQKRGLFPRDFLYWAGEGFVWLYMYEDGMNVPKEFEVIDFQGGLYAVATDIDQKTDREIMNAEIDRFLSENGLEMSIDGKAKIFAHLLRAACKEPTLIRGILSGMLLANSNLFSKKNR